MEGYQTLPSERIIEGRTILLVPLEHQHLDGLWDQLRNVHNAELFAHCYGTHCASKPDLWRTLAASRRRWPDSLTLTILDKPTRRSLGWAVLRPAPDEPGVVHESHFLQRASCGERGTEAIHCLARLVFNELEFERLEWRVGKRDPQPGSRGGPTGYTLVDVLTRQLRDAARSRESDLYVLTRRQWPCVYAAFKAWLDSRVGWESGEGVGHPMASVNCGVM